ncbi:TIGR03617 family F420-dependent LLM class oxidoreductase [Streptomyces sp. NPDC021093]|uniref:TIGR03617 family F420-dependent LLM class oxidoreductase n=1 Tax=Streptomyces sp. NPDC021093 TaxID=3365112 RepID=UPI0037BCBA9B
MSGNHQPDRLRARAPRMKLALSCPSDCRDVRAIAAEAERRGVDRFTMAETAGSPFLQLARAADATSSIELGTGVAIALARTPMTMAYDAWGLHEISRGRAALGLGSQVKAHVTRRFGMPWDRPAARMREFVQAVRAVWHSWETGERLRFRGDFYRHTLMSPAFTPRRVAAPSPPILLAGVGPRMVRSAGAVADGFVSHAFTTADYLRQRVLPVLAEARTGAEAQGAAWTARPFEVVGNVLTATGRSEEELKRSIGGVRERIAFYGSTPAYRMVLEQHGWGELHRELHSLSLRGRWGEMTDLVDDEVFATFAVAGSPAEVAREIHRRYRDVFTTLCVSAEPATDPEPALDVLTELRALN